MAESISQERSAGPLIPDSSRLAHLLLVAAMCLGLFQVYRLFRFIDRYSVDVPYWDQWDYYQAFVTPHTLWVIFAWQHGPHRQGIGFFLTWLVNELTDWNQRAQGFTIGLVMLSAALATLWLKRRLFGSLRWYDLIPVLFILSLRQWEIYASTPNVSHGAMPLLLVILSCLAWTVRNVYLRYGLVLILGFLATYTGFGMFVGMINPLLLAADLWLARERRSRGDLIAASVALLLAILSLASFYTNYLFAPAVNNFQFPDPNWHLYPAFMSLQFAGLFGRPSSGVGRIVLGFMIMAGLLAILANSAVRLLRAAAQDTPARVIFFLLAFAMAFSANAAVGRLCLGLGAAGSSRYYPLLVPAALGLYFALLARPAGRTKDALILLLLSYTLFATMGVKEQRHAKSTFEGKTRWVAAYLESPQVQALAESPQAGARLEKRRVIAVNKKADFKVYPLENEKFALRLMWLRQHHYSFFRKAVLPISRPTAPLERLPTTVAAVGL